MKSRTAPALLLIVAVAIFSGCAVGPDDKRPPVTLGGGWQPSPQ